MRGQVGCLQRKPHLSGAPSGQATVPRCEGWADYQLTAFTERVWGVPVSAPLLKSATETTRENRSFFSFLVPMRFKEKKKCKKRERCPEMLLSVHAGSGLRGQLEEEKLGSQGACSRSCKLHVCTHATASNVDVETPSVDAAESPTVQVSATASRSFCACAQTVLRPLAPPPRRPAPPPSPFAPPTSPPLSSPAARAEHCGTQTKCPPNRLE